MNYIKIDTSTRRIKKDDLFGLKMLVLVLLANVLIFVNVLIFNGSQPNIEFTNTSNEIVNTEIAMQELPLFTMCEE